MVTEIILIWFLETYKCFIKKVEINKVMIKLKIHFRMKKST